MVNIDQARIAGNAGWDGLKSYVTNTNPDACEVIRQYHGLWVVERAFRVSKGTLETRPVFHFTGRRIEAHICICFMAYKVYKELERILRMLGIELSVDKVMNIAKTISMVTINMTDGQTKQQVMFPTHEQRMLTPLILSEF
ncbi:MAG: transposase [Mediterranea sp.]|nr:transposase [Mediterranea sp.]